VISKGSPREIETRVGKFGLPHTLIEGESNISGQYRAKWTPAAVVVGSNGRIVTPIVYGEEGVSKLVNETFLVGLESESQPYGRDIALGFSSYKVGDIAPRFTLKDLQGKVYESERFLGRETLLLFWNPTCPWCEKISDELRRWEESRPDGAPELVIIAWGGGQELMMTGNEFQSLILADPEFDIGPMFGTGGTPSAVLIDQDGRIASAVAHGPLDVMALTGYGDIASLEELQASIAVQ
jgi:thiol-disulfide isomerase/thioredoxin